MNNTNIITEEKRQRGRPPGTNESPHSLLKQDLQATLKLSAQIRSVIKDQVEKIKERLAEDLNLTDRVKAAEALASLLDILTKSIKQTSSLVINELHESEDVVRDEERVMKELFGK